MEYSLPYKPYGITINGEGVITVSAGAELEDENSVTVQARYRGGTYTAVLFIGKDTRRYTPRYLGTIDTLPETADVFILKGPARGQTHARQGDYVLAVANGYAWQAGRVYQWAGTAWEYRDPGNYSDLYIRSFKDGLEVPELTQDMGWFGALIAERLVAQRAFIETLGAQVIELLGGGRIKSKDFVSGETGFQITADGDAEFMNVTSLEFKSGSKGYLPIGFIYFQLRGQPEPGALFSGVWENISTQYAGLFFRVEGGNAAGFGSDQGQSIQPHTHGYDRFYDAPNSVVGGGTNVWYTSVTSGYNYSIQTGSTGSTETRPVNTTIRVWIRRS
jgi:hypothetical protein